MNAPSSKSLLSPRRRHPQDFRAIDKEIKRLTLAFAVEIVSIWLKHKREVG